MPEVPPSNSVVHSEPVLLSCPQVDAYKNKNYSSTVDDLPSSSKKKKGETRPMNPLRFIYGLTGEESDSRKSSGPCES